MRKCYRNIVFIFSIALLFSCENSDPGCLDLNAENFDVFAVSECDSCCVYPDGNINLAFRYDTMSFSFNTEFAYGDSDTIMVSDFQLPISQFSFYADGKILKVRDTLRGQSPRIYDDYILKKKSSADIAIGKTSFVEEIDSVSFVIGLDESMTLGLRPYEDVDQNSNFIKIIDEMYVDTIEELFQARISLTINDSLKELELKHIEEPSLVFEISETVSPGIEWTFPLNIDMRKVIDGIHPDDTNEVMATTISKNISQSFSNR